MVDSGVRHSLQARFRPRPGLHCEQCGLRYAEGAIARESTLLPGVPCRRCGGTLAPDRTDPSPDPDARVLP
jgi:hypothetical protein